MLLRQQLVQFLRQQLVLLLRQQFLLLMRQQFVLLRRQQLITEAAISSITVTDGVEGVCADPGEMGAILEVGEGGGPGPLGGGKGGQLALDSGGG
jgi:hypothetical protein